ncbi:hypothetical protein BKA64DRAFT_331219 [Cadophora sp. MPI-SDFR-AT-0126]|nr:hypothetical protein BKA64DRAFT_331219 [Leotiomycetes sp. MPI-SDFR-AT-0126]
MSGFEIAGLVLSVLPSISAPLDFVERILGSARAYRRQKFGNVVQLPFLDTDIVQEFHRNINYWSDEELKTWKASYIAGCNAIAVAAAIFASIGLTALQLPNLNEVHWTARAIFSASMVFGILSVLSATTAHSQIGLLNDPLALRLWLSRGGPPSNIQYPEPYSGLPLQSSVSAILVLKLPKALLNLAGFSYIIAFGLYLILSWREAVPTTNDDYRNVLVVFVLCVGLVIVYQNSCFFQRILDDAKASHEFQYRRLGATLEKSPELEALESQLQSFQKKSDLRDDIEALTSEMRAMRDEFNITRPVPTGSHPTGISPSKSPEGENILGSHQPILSGPEDTTMLRQDLRALRDALNTFRSVGKSSD